VDTAAITQARNTLVQRRSGEMAELTSGSAKRRGRTTGAECSNPRLGWGLHFYQGAQCEWVALGGPRFGHRSQSFLHQIRPQDGRDVPDDVGGSVRRAPRDTNVVTGKLSGPSAGCSARPATIHLLWDLLQHALHLLRGDNPAAAVGV
jgi:hypothetical protein